MTLEAGRVLAAVLSSRTAGPRALAFLVKIKSIVITNGVSLPRLPETIVWVSCVWMVCKILCRPRRTHYPTLPSASAQDWIGLDWTGSLQASHQSSITQSPRAESHGQPNSEQRTPPAIQSLCPLSRVVQDQEGAPRGIERVEKLKSPPSPHRVHLFGLLIRPCDRPLPSPSIHRSGPCPVSHSRSLLLGLGLVVPPPPIVLASACPALPCP